MSTENQQQRPQNCWTGHCSCVECLFEQPAQQINPETRTEADMMYWPNYVAGYDVGLKAAQEPAAWLKVIETPGGWGKFVGAKPHEKGAKPVYTSPQPNKPLTESESRVAFEAFVRRELGDIAVMDGGRYISQKINNYWRTWQAAHGINGHV